MAPREEAGQALPLVAALVVITGFAALGIAEVGGAAADRARAQTAADAAALAWAANGRSAANEVARANGARLVGGRFEGGTVLVRAKVGEMQAEARATRPAAAALPAHRGHKGLAPAMRAAIARAGQLLGRPVPVTSGYRSRADQERLWEQRHRNLYPVAPPGSSRHETGLAIDVPVDFVPSLLEVAADSGLCQPYPRTDPVHFELCPPG